MSPTHPFLVALEELQKSGLGVVNIVLEPLRRVHLIELIDDSLKTSDGGALADAVLKKTGGNPFFVKQFMRSPSRDQACCVFDPATGWRWDLPQIERLEYTDNVLGLMAETIRRLPQATQEVLRLAAAIGNTLRAGRPRYRQRALSRRDLREPRQRPSRGLDRQRRRAATASRTTRSRRPPTR